MSLRLPRVPSDLLGMKFQVWWQRVVEAIEGAVNNISQLLIDVGIAQETADGALERATSAINEDGTIKNDKVLTPSIIDNAVTERYLSQILSDITLPDGVETDVVSVSVTKGDYSDIDLDVSLRLKSSDDVRGTINIYRGPDLIDSFEPFMNGSGGTFRVSQTLPFTDSGVAAGTYVYKATFLRSGGASALSAAAGSLIRAKEIKK